MKVSSQDAMQEKEKVKFYHWIYDNGSEGFAVRDSSNWKRTEKAIQRDKLFESKDDRRAYQRDLEAALKGKEIAIQKKKLKIHTGLKYFCKSDAERKEPATGQNGWKQLSRLLHMQGKNREMQKELLMLFSGILAGYCARLSFYCNNAFDYVSQPKMRAPILSVSYADWAFDVLERWASALMINTSFSGKLAANYSSVIPSHMHQTQITDCAYITLSKSQSKFKFPLQLRDASVLLHCHFFSSKDIFQFQQQNRWASLVLFDCPKKNTLISPIRISGRLLAESDCEWEVEPVHYLLNRFVYYLSKLVEKRKKAEEIIHQELSSIERCIFRYHQQQGIKGIHPSEKFQYKQLMLALSLFLKSCVKDASIDMTAAELAKAQWYHTILPGCYDVPMEGSASEMVGEQQDDQNIFEEALRQMLSAENLSHFLYVPSKGCCDENDPEDPNFHYWGYLRYYAPKNKLSLEFCALQFRRSYLVRLLPDFIGDYDPESLIDTDFFDSYHKRWHDFSDLEP